MPNLRDLLIKDADNDLARAKMLARRAIKNKRDAEQYPSIELPFSASVLQFSGRVEITTYMSGNAQEVANAMTLEMGIRFEKSFLPDRGFHNYTGKHGEVEIVISGKPPESCELRPIETMVKKITYEVVCEEASNA